nr:MAG TPA: hypothetical protein [Caudoviricetes sp.]
MLKSFLISFLVASYIIFAFDAWGYWAKWLY